ncbi:hypothetical protein P3X46_005787 [Hevea brasiliensis]|uniref:Diacylglycerol O-acyltransferase 3, cytosolic n=1 Tax=Hevea brasiliensis TaxID=3981 RepID=A0ABQ9MNL1_HEVBR|nr:diacylglycerol O-acyltransferase 3 [Hevea brasiliensis]KAJ9181721.1 hypothetical protein P3X46_005787 [Hevea brasiliensis]
MEVSGFALRQPSCFPFGADVGTCNAQSSSRPSFCGVSLKPRKACRVLNSSEFRDNGHLQHYHGGENKMEKKSVKKKLKLLKGLYKDLSMFSRLGVDDALVDQGQAELLSEAAQGLMKQLQELRAKEKELKRKKKEEKAKLKAKRIDCESSTSESSDSECGELIDMSRLRSEAFPVAQPMLADFQQQEVTSTLTILPAQKLKAIGASPNLEKEWCVEPSVCCDDRNSSAKRIEVCMGNKCKKAGGAALLEELERVVGVEGAVVGCKCMGKCRDGPNVRVRNSIDERNIGDSVRTPANPLCIGVGLEDVGVIVAHFSGEDKQLGLAHASHT